MHVLNHLYPDNLDAARDLAFNNIEYSSFGGWDHNICHGSLINNMSKMRGYVRKREQVVVGFGMRDFVRATNLLFNFDHVNRLNWVNMARHCSVLQKGDCIASVSKFYSTPIWSFNPCKITNVFANNTYTTDADALTIASDVLSRGESRSNSSFRYCGRMSEVVFSTLQGHMIAGQEAMRVFTVPLELQHLFNIERSTKKVIKTKGWRGSADEVVVVFEVESHSRGSGVLGTLYMPLLRPLQTKFMRDCCKSMALLMNS